MDAVVEPPRSGDQWLGLCSTPLPNARAQEWLGRPDCGAVVLFSGNARDHSEGRTGVEALTYEAYEPEADRRIDAVAAEIRRRWPEVARIVVLHRTGEVAVGQPAVLVGVSSAHRAAAFDAARFGIEAVKASVPLWKRERWDGGADWGLDGAELVDATAVATPGGDR